MISAISRVITNPYLVNIAQSSDASVATKTTVNSVGRPGFILIDKNIDLETKKFAATKEFLYQATSLLVYMALIVPIFKNGAFKIANDRIQSLGKDHSVDKFKHDNLREALINEVTPEKYNNVKGAIEVGNIVGSIVGLSVLAPNVSQVLIRPVLKVLGLDKKVAPKAKEQKIKAEVDKMA